MIFDDDDYDDNDDDDGDDGDDDDDDDDDDDGRCWQTYLVLTPSPMHLAFSSFSRFPSRSSSPSSKASSS